MVLRICINISKDVQSISNVIKCLSIIVQKITNVSFLRDRNERIAILIKI